MSLHSNDPSIDSDPVWEQAESEASKHELPEIVCDFFEDYLKTHKVNLFRTFEDWLTERKYQSLLKERSNAY